MGTYGALSAIAHPSYAASRELRIDGGQRFTYSYPFDYVERLARMALFGLFDAFKHWLDYYDHDHDRLVGCADEIVDRWNAFVVTQGVAELDESIEEPRG
jgi:hypothetical protein